MNAGPQWLLKIFLSVDIVGSTQFKSGTRDKWSETFEEFFAEFPTHLVGQYSDPVLGGGTTHHPTPWKFIGDEIVFSANLSSSQEPQIHLSALKMAMNKYEERWQEAERKGLMLKATAWVAGFPVSNLAVRIPIPNSSEFLEDYIGPDMDAGFRLSRFSNPRKCPVSASLALMLATRAAGKGVLFYDGKHVLKGVNQSSPYPVFWYDMRQDSKEDDLTGLKPAMNEHVSAFLEPLFQRPFIADASTDDPFQDIPRWAKEQYNKLNQSLEVEDPEVDDTDDIPPVEATEGQ